MLCNTSLHNPLKLMKYVMIDRLIIKKYFFHKSGIESILVMENTSPLFLNNVVDQTNFLPKILLIFKSNVSQVSDNMKFTML